MERLTRFDIAEYLGGMVSSKGSPSRRIAVVVRLGLP